MAERPIWRGHLRLALVTCPVSLHSVLRSSGDLRFHLINPETKHRVRMVTLDAETNEEVARRDLIKGYEFEKDRYVLLDDDDFDRAKIETSSTMTIDKFVDQDVIDPIYFDTSYYLAPDGEAGQDVYVVLHEAIAETRKAAVSRVVISRRERAVVIMPLDKGLVLHTLHEPRDLYDYHPLFGHIADTKPDAEMVKLARQLIERQVGKFVPEDTEDRYETRLREVIDAKLKGEGIKPPEPEALGGDNVIDLMAALKRSLGGAEGKSAPTSATTTEGRKKAPTRKAAPKADGKTRTKRTATRKRA